MRQILEKHYEHDVDINNLLIDFPNLILMSIPNKLIKMMQLTLNETRGDARYENDFLRNQQWNIITGCSHL